MIKKNKGDKKAKETATKVSYYCKPDNQTLEQWQIALRRQIATKEHLAISETNRKELPGYYQVTNPQTRSTYRVVYRGEGNRWNYCSCMDFKTNQLGTCKHLEAVGLWLKENRHPVRRAVPPYTSVYLSYKGERKVCLRIGTDHEAEFRKLAEPYFTPDGVLRPEAHCRLMDFFREAMRLDNTFRWYSDALDFVLEQRDKGRRRQMLAEVASDVALDKLLKTQLYPYQKEGIRFAFCAGKSIIADEMGLGKTIQAIGTAELMRKHGFITSALVVCPTSLKYQWKREIERFTDACAVVVEGNHLKRKQLYASPESYKIVSYNSLCNDIKILGHIHTDFLIMDEVQRLKNWNTQLSRAARRIESEYSVVLSGTPLENKLEELYSIMQFVDQYCLGPYYKFMNETVLTSETGKVIGYRNLNAVGERMKDVLIRRRKRDVALQLPQRLDKVLFVPMTKEQRDMHDEWQFYVSQIVNKWNRMRFLSEKDRKRLLLMLSQMRMVCDSTFILDQKSRHDTKVEETMNILRTVFESGDEKVVVFSQWERMTRLIAAELDAMGVRYEYLHGGVPSEMRKNLVENFTTLPESRVFLSTDAGSTGLNLQVASLLINLDLPWNPAVLEQRIARIYRIGQQRNIQVINLVAAQTIEERMLSTLNFKSSLFEGILDNGEDTIFLEDSKLEKIMDSIKVMATPAETEEESGGQLEEEKLLAPEESVPGDEEGLPPVDDVEPMLPFEEDEPSGQAAASVAASESSYTPGEATANADEPELLIRQGLSFLGGLARTLKSAEATRKLVDSLVEENPQTGETTLRIPVSDKESVVDLLSLFGKLMGGKG